MGTDRGLSEVGVGRKGLSDTARDGEARELRCGALPGDSVSIPIPLGGRPCPSHEAQESLVWLYSGLSCLSSGFYLISPSEFERFSLSTKWLVEPRCLVDSAKARNHNRPSNGNSTGPKRTSGQVR